MYMHLNDLYIMTLIIHDSSLPYYIFNVDFYYWGFVSHHRGDTRSVHCTIE